jgi:hypothetical protein
VRPMGGVGVTRTAASVVAEWEAAQAAAQEAALACRRQGGPPKALGSQCRCATRVSRSHGVECACRHGTVAYLCRETPREGLL